MLFIPVPACVCDCATGVWGDTPRGERRRILLADSSVYIVGRVIVADTMPRYGRPRVVAGRRVVNPDAGATYTLVVEAGMGTRDGRHGDGARTTVLRLS